MLVSLYSSAFATQPAPDDAPAWMQLQIQKPAPIDRFSVAGEGAIPVIIIPELGCDETIYADFAKRHASRFTTHTLVLPGAAKDSKPPALDRGHVRDPEWLVNAANAVVEYATQNKLENPLVIGQGVGGTVAYMLAIRNPEFARGYVVVNALPAPSVGGPGRVPLKEQRSAEVDKLERAALLSMTQASWDNRARSRVPQQTTNPERAAALIASYASTPIGAVRRYSLEPLYLDMREQLDGAKSPILVYLALPDSIKEADARMLRAVFQNVGYNRPNIRVEILEGARQWAMLDEADRFDPPLLAFLGLPPLPAAAPEQPEEKPQLETQPELKSETPPEIKPETTPAPEPK